jgi:hypothetical protein
MKVADMIADDPGRWLYHCHVAEHMQEGMFTRMEILARDAVGVDRSPEKAFLGLPSATRSLRIDRAEVVVNQHSSPVTTRLLIGGAISIPEDFPVEKTPIRVSLAGKSVTFEPNARGVAETDGAGWWADIDDGNVIRGQVMKFELSFNTPEWLALLGSKAETRSLPLTIEIGTAHHVANVSVKSRVIP